MLWSLVSWVVAIFVMFVPGIVREPTLAEMISEERAALGLGPLTPDATLDAIAAGRVQEIRTDFSHGDRLGRLSWTYGFRTELLGENLCRTEHDEARCVAMWMESPGHHALIVGDWTLIGSATYSEGGVTWAVVVFR